MARGPWSDSMNDFQNFNELVERMKNKADTNMSDSIRSMIARSRIHREERERRRVKFLPQQVLRRAFEAQGVDQGPVFKQLRRTNRP
jgi:hypothetical protein